MNSPRTPINVRVKYTTIYPLVYKTTLDSLYTLLYDHIHHTLITKLPHKAI